MDSFQATLEQPLAEVDAALRAALSRQGFGILSDIDISATLAAKLGVDRPPLRILGACNPSFAHRALGIDPSLALLLPCNVVLEDAGAGRTRVSIADPRALVAAGAKAGDEQLVALGVEAAAALERAIGELER